MLRALTLVSLVLVPGLVLALARPVAAAPTFGPSSGGLALALTAAPVKGALTIDVTIANTSDHPITLWSHVATHEMQFDWLEVEVSWRGARLERDHARVRRGPGVRHPLHKVCTARITQTIRFMDDRDKSAPVAVTLAPGTTVHHAIDLAQWAGRAVNGALALPPGRYELRATYRVTGEPAMWNGAISSPAIAARIPGAVANDRCDQAP